MVPSVEKLQFFEDFSSEDIFQSYPFFQTQSFHKTQNPYSSKKLQNFFLPINGYKKQAFNHSKRNLSKKDIDAVEIYAAETKFQKRS